MKFLILLFVGFFTILMTCGKTNNTLDAGKCGNEYSFINDQFNEDTKLTGNIRYIILSNKLDTINLDLVETTNILNSYFLQAAIKMNIAAIDTIYIDGIKNNMPSFIEHASKYNKDGVINVYIYSNNQPYFSGEENGIRGRVAAIPSRSIAIRDVYLNTSTLAHETCHALGLRHVHEPDPTTGYSIVTGDLVCDTRSFNSFDELVDEDCNYVGPNIEAPDNQEKYTCNLLSYAVPKCRTCLTEGQLKRMRFVIHSSLDLRAVFGYTNANL